MAQPVAKVRSRKDGSAVPLDELDRKLLNLLQGSFPIAARPFAHVAELAGVPEQDVLAPNQAAAGRAHHPRDHADLRHARARLQLDAGCGEGRCREPVAGGQDHQLAPRRVAQLPARSRLQPLVHHCDRAGLSARPGRHARGARAPHRSRVRAPASHPAALQDPHGPGDGEGNRGAGGGRGDGRPQGARGDRALGSRLRGHRCHAGCRWRSRRSRSRQRRPS